MKAFLFYLLVLLIIEKANAQFGPEQVYIMGEHYLEQECRVETYPDWGDLVFVNDSLFLTLSFISPDGRHDSLCLSGKYKVQRDTLKLTDIKTARDLWFHERPEFETYRIEHKDKFEKVFPEMQFKMDKCKGGQLVLRSLVGDKTWFGTLDPRGEGTIRYYKEHGIWNKALNPPQH